MNAQAAAAPSPNAPISYTIEEAAAVAHLAIALSPTSTVESYNISDAVKLLDLVRTEMSNQNTPN